MYDSSIIGRHKTEVDSPALLLDMGAVERNIARMARFFEGKDCKLRPHIKTHKLPLIGHKQIDAGAIGVTCAKIREAEVFLQSGIKNVLIANQIAGDAKIRRLVNLSRYGDLIVCVDNFENAEAISKAAEAIGVKMSVLVEVNVGLNRCGVLYGQPTLDFVRQISKLKGIVFRGVMGYEGGVFVEDVQEKEKICRTANERLVNTAELVRKDGFPVEIVSAGGSNTYRQTGVYPGITDVQVGSYVTMDSHNAKFGIDFEQAIFILATVISRPASDRAITNAGKKAISSDAGFPTPVNPGLELYALSEEHGHIRIIDPASAPSIGDNLLLIPTHGCTTIPLYDSYIIIRDDRVESIAEIQARQTS